MNSLLTDIEKPKEEGHLPSWLVSLHHFSDWVPGATLPPAALFPRLGLVHLCQSWIMVGPAEVALLAESLWVCFQVVAYSQASRVPLL